jgi:hypothetical protein
VGPHSREASQRVWSGRPMGPTSRRHASAIGLERGMAGARLWAEEGDLGLAGIFHFFLILFLFLALF